MEIKGRIKVKGDDQQVSGSFVKRELVVSTDEQYPQHILINFIQDKCDLLDKYNVGDFVEVGVNIRGREWVSPAGETKYFNTIQGWKIQYDRERQPANNEPAPKVHYAKPIVEEEHDDLPF